MTEAAEAKLGELKKKTEKNGTCGSRSDKRRQNLSGRAAPTPDELRNENGEVGGGEGQNRG